MKKLLITILVGILALLALSACAASETPTTPPSLSVTGSGQVYLTPDLAYIYVGVLSESESVADAVSQNTRSAQSVVAALKEMGIKEEDIQTTSFNIYPYQQYNMNGEPTEMKYVVDNTVRIIARDLDKLGTLLEKVIGAGANNINGITFDVEDKTAAFAEARKLAIQNAREQAEEIAGIADVSLGKLLSLSVYGANGEVTYFGEKIYSGGMGGGDVPMSSGQLVITATANLLFEIK